MLPVFNERESLPELHRRLSLVLDELDLEGELLFVDVREAHGVATPEHRERVDPLALQR